MQAVRNELSFLIISQRAARRPKTTLGVSGRAESWEKFVGLDVAHRAPRTEYIPGSLVAAALEPIGAPIAASVHEMLSDIPAGIAEDVVRGKIRLAGGGALLPGLANRIEIAGGIGAVVVEDPLRVRGPTAPPMSWSARARIRACSPPLARASNLPRVVNRWAASRSW